MQNALATAWLVLLLGPPWVGQVDQVKKQPPDEGGLKALQHPDAEVRFNAAQIIVDLGPVAKFSIPALHAALKEEKNTLVRVKIVEAIWVVEKPAPRELVAVLVQSLGDKDDAARANAANVLGLMGSGAKAAVPALAKALQDKDLTVRAEVALALGEIGPAAKSAVPELLETLKSEDLVFVEPLVLGTLGKIGADAVPALVDALSAKQYRLRRGAAYALGLIGPKAAEASAGLSLLLADSEPELRSQAAIALGKIGPLAKQILPKLQQSLNDKEPAVRVQAAVALWKVGQDDRGLAELVRAMAAEEPKIREHACAGLAELAGTKKVPVGPLQAALSDPATTVRQRAAQTLGKLGPTARPALPALREACKDASGLVKVQSATAIWQIDLKAMEPVGLLIGWLGEKEVSTRKAAAVSLGEIGPAAAAGFDPLYKLFREDVNVQVRRAAAVALKQINPAEATKLRIR
jgi:HEAT repeat protein